MQHVFIAGATGYLGRFLVSEYNRRGWHVTALVRDAGRAADLPAHRLVEAQATRADTLAGLMEGADLVVSSLGITRQTDGLSYRDVDYQANANLLDEALRAGVRRFAYVHVLGAKQIPDVPLVAAKQAFVDLLHKAPIEATVIAPSGYFSDMADFLSMAQSGRVWLFGDGLNRINPIHGADLAAAVAQATEQGTDWLDIGGPEIFTHHALAELAFATLARPTRITCLPDALRRVTLAVLPWITPARIHGPAQFFLTAIAQDMVGARHGSRSLRDTWATDTGQV